MDDGKGHMEFSRYPFSTDYKYFFYITDFNNVVIDVENFNVRMKEIGQNLEQLSGYFQNLVDEKMKKTKKDPK